MKLIISIVQDKDSTLLSDALVEKGIQATKLASTGGFLKTGNTTFLIGVPEEKVEETLDCIKENCKERQQLIDTPTAIGAFPVPMMMPQSVRIGGATVFVVDTEQFLHF